MTHEPKFKIGDWINFIGNKLNYGRIYYIDDKGYYLEDATFIHFDNEHLWEMFYRLQIFRNQQGEIVCIKCGWIAVDIPEGSVPAQAPDPEIVGFSDHAYIDRDLSYWDIAFPGYPAFLHIYRWDFGRSLPSGFKPFFFEIYPA